MFSARVAEGRTFLRLAFTGTPEIERAGTEAAVTRLRSALAMRASIYHVFNLRHCTCIG